MVPSASVVKRMRTQACSWKGEDIFAAAKSATPAQKCLTGHLMAEPFREFHAKMRSTLPPLSTDSTCAHHMFWSLLSENFYYSALCTTEVRKHPLLGSPGSVPWGNIVPITHVLVPSSKPTNYLAQLYPVHFPCSWNTPVSWIGRSVGLVYKPNDLSSILGSMEREQERNNSTAIWFPPVFIEIHTIIVITIFLKKEFP